MSEESSLYGLLAGFETQQQVKDAAQRAYAAGYRKMDAYTPFPVKELPEALGHQKTKKVQLVFLLGGFSGLSIAYFLQGWSQSFAWPLDIGGKPPNSWPMFIPITFETTVLLSAICGFLGMLIFNRLPEPYHPVFNAPEFRRAIRDRFFLCIEAADPQFDPMRTWELLQSLNPYHLSRVPK